MSSTHVEVLEQLCEVGYEGSGDGAEVTRFKLHKPLPAAPPCKFRKTDGFQMAGICTKAH